MGCDSEDYCKKDSCPDACYTLCPSLCTSYSSPPDQNRSISANLIIVAGVLGTAFLLGICWILILNLYSKWKASRRVINSDSSTRVLSRADEDFLDGNNNHRQVVEHHVWYINTVGLQQAVIDSINVIRFKKSEGLIEGTECSVCLSVFEDDETLRLLPKCNHAFHLPCIDTWLRSHKNCPLCRAPVVRESSGGELSSGDSRSAENPRVENSVNNDRSGRGSDLLDEDSVSEMSSRSEGLDETQVGIERISSDAMNHHAPRQEVEQVRRSVSLDSSSASVIYRTMADAEEREVKSLNLQRALAKSGSGTSNRTSVDEGSSVYRFMKRTMVLKKSLSSNGKFSASPAPKTSQASILPF